jgi:hypothetical protein
LIRYCQPLVLLSDAPLIDEVFRDVLSQRVLYDTRLQASSCLNDAYPLVCPWRRFDS